MFKCPTKRSYGVCTPPPCLLYIYIYIYPAHKGVESRLQDPSVQSPKGELRRGLVPKLPAVVNLPRVALEEEEEAHRRECEDREGRWDSELAETLTTAEEVSQGYS